MKSLAFAALLILAAVAPGLAQTVNPSVVPGPLTTSDHGMRASRMIGTPVYDAAGEQIGTIADIVMKPLHAGEPMAIVAARGGYVSGGDRMIAMPVSRLRVDAQDHLVVPGASKETVGKMPAYTQMR